MRTSLLRTACAASLLLAAGVAVAKQPSKGPEDRTVQTEDGWTLPITYYPANNKEAPVVILLHGKGGNRQVWKDVAEGLNKERYAVVTVDLRKHGDSQSPPNSGPKSERLTPADYQKMCQFDLEAVKKFILNEHHAEKLNIRKTGIVAADDMAPVAANFALLDWLRKPWPDAPTLQARTPRGQDVRAVALLSPTEGSGGLNLGRALADLRNEAWKVGFWIAVGAEDRDDRNTAMKSYERLTGGGGTSKERVFLDRFDRVKNRGTELLGVRGADVRGKIIGFLNKNLRDLPDKWQNRKSRLG